MNKFVAFCSLLAVAAAKPGVYAPLTYATYGSGYSVPAAPVLQYSAPLVHSAPLLHSAPLAYTAPAHYIKKRSAYEFPIATAGTYIAPSSYATSPLLTTYSSPLVHHASPYYATGPLAYSHHYLKKRSAPLALSTYYAPTSYSHQSRFDIHTSSPVVTSYTAPVAYSSPFAYSHYF